MKLEFKWSRLEFFAALELYQIIMARESVFVVEQHCPYQETDELVIRGLITASLRLAG